MTNVAILAIHVSNMVSVSIMGEKFFPYSSVIYLSFVGLDLVKMCLKMNCGCVVLTVLCLMAVLDKECQGLLSLVLVVLLSNQRQSNIYNLLAR